MAYTWNRRTIKWLIVQIKLSSWRGVRIVWTTLDYATKIFDDFIEFHGDRNFRDDGAILGGIASLAGRPVTIVGIQKGKSFAR